MSFPNFSAIKRFIKGNTTVATGTNTVSAVFNTVSTGTAVTATATAIYTGTSKKKFALPADGFLQIVIGGTAYRLPYYKA